MSARVGVFGATGYTGRELVRLLRRHPRARVAFTTGSDDRSPRPRGRARPGGRRLLPRDAPRHRRDLRRAAARGAAGGDRGRPLRRPAPPDRRELQAVVRPRPQGPAPHRRGGLRPVRGVPGPPARRPARLEPGVLRHVGPPAPHPAPPRGPHRPVRHRRGRQERRHGRRPHAARGPPLLRGRRELLGLLAGPHAPARGRDRGGSRRPHRPARRADLLPAPAAGEARDPDRPLREAEGRPRRAEAGARGRLRRHGLRPRDGRRSAAPVGRGRDERLPDLRARGRSRPRRRLLRPRQPREGRGGAGHPEPEPLHGLAGDGRPRLGLRPPPDGTPTSGGQASVAS